MQARPATRANPVWTGVHVRNGWFVPSAATRGSLEVAPAVRDGALQLYADARAAGRDAVIIWFGHPRLAGAFGDEAPLVCAWSGDPCMQSAAARWLANQRA